MIELQKQPDGYTCLATAFAMCWGMDVRKVLSQLPDPKEIIFPKNPEPMNRRGHHVDELIVLGAQNSWTSFIIESKLRIYNAVNASEYHEIDNCLAVIRFMNLYDGVVLYKTIAGVRHAVAWDHNLRKCCNPNGTVHDLVSVDWFVPVY